MSRPVFTTRDGAVIDLHDIRVEIFIDKDGLPVVSVSTDRNLSKDFIKVEVDGRVVEEGRYREELEYDHND